MSGSANDLRSDVRIGSVIANSGDSAAINTTFCLHGPTGSRRAARFLSSFLAVLCMLMFSVPVLFTYYGMIVWFMF